jgi:Cu(I)/Ag(I) efflux system protein CusF
MRRIAIALFGAALAAASAWASGHAFTEAEVRKVDREAGKVTLKHGEISNLEMPPMTMVFRVKDPAMLDRLKEGEKIRFRAEKLGGQITVTEIEAPK